MLLEAKKLLQRLRFVLGSIEWILLEMLVLVWMLIVTLILVRGNEIVNLTMIRSLLLDG